MAVDTTGLATIRTVMPHRAILVTQIAQLPVGTSQAASCHVITQSILAGGATQQSTGSAILGRWTLISTAWGQIPYLTAVMTRPIYGATGLDSAHTMVATDTIASGVILSLVFLAFGVDLVAIITNLAVRAIQTEASFRVTSSVETTQAARLSTLQPELGGWAFLITELAQPA